MQNENNNEFIIKEDETTVAEQKSQLHQITPLSKYLAMALFIILPFLGAYIGYVNAPEKEMGTEDMVFENGDREKAEKPLLNNDGMSKFEPRKYSIRNYKNLEKWEVWLMEADKLGEYQKILKLADASIVRAVVRDNKLYAVSGEELTVVNLSNMTKEIYETQDYVKDFFFTEKGVYLQMVDDEICTDFPTAIGRCAGSLALLDTEGNLTVVESDILGAKGIVAYTPEKSVVLRDGYGDAGCTDTKLVRYDLNTKATSTLYSDVFCYESASSEENEKGHQLYEAGVNTFISSLTETEKYVSNLDFGFERYAEWTYDGDNAEGVTLEYELTDKERQVEKDDNLNIYTTRVGIP